MKKVFITLLAFVSIALISSCTKSPAENMVGEWKITDIQTTYEVPEDQMEAYNEALNGMKESSKMIYKADGTFEKTISEETTTGKWVISEDGKSLTETSDDGTIESVILLELTENKFISESELDDTKNTMTFEKIK